MVHIGISGWDYPAWRGRFYPRGLARHRWLAFAAQQLSTVELNGTFYSLKRPEDYAAWASAVPPGFLFAVKGGRFITHMKKLRDVEVPLANFYASGVLALEEKTGPFLWQLPEMVAFDAARLERFFALLPRSSTEAAALARHHDHRLDGRALVRCDVDIPYRHALEPRHPSFFTREASALLRAHEVGLVVADTAGRFPTATDVTAPFVYVRLHGADVLYASEYTDTELAPWAARIARWRRALDVYVYFDNDARGHAPFDALRLAGLVDDERLTCSP